MNEWFLVREANGEASRSGQRAMRASSNTLCREAGEGVPALRAICELLRIQNTKTSGCDTQFDRHHAAASGVQSTGRPYSHACTNGFHRETLKATCQHCYHL